MCVYTFKYTPIAKNLNVNSNNLWVVELQGFFLFPCLYFKYFFYDEHIICGFKKIIFGLFQ